MAARSLFYFRETAAVLAGALRERWKEVTGGDSTWLWSRTGRFAMRTEFRFAKTAAVRMTIILAGVISAIQTGEAIPARFIRCTRVVAGFRGRTGNILCRRIDRVGDSFRNTPIGGAPTG